MSIFYLVGQSRRQLNEVVHTSAKVAPKLASHHVLYDDAIYIFTLSKFIPLYKYLIMYTLFLNYPEKV